MIIYYEREYIFLQTKFKGFSDSGKFGFSPLE